jgi:hypothetical protein
MATALDLIGLAKAARENDACVKEEQRLHAEKIAGIRASMRARKTYEALVEKELEREYQRHLMYDTVEYVEGADTEGARRVRALLERQSQASRRARAAGDPLNITKHTKKATRTARRPEVAEVEVPDPYGQGKVTAIASVADCAISQWARGVNGRKPKLSRLQIVAADWFRGRYESAGLVSIRSVDYEKPIVDGGRPMTDMGDNAHRAARDIQEVRAWLEKDLGRLGSHCFSILEEIVGKERPLKDVAPQFTDQLYKMADGEVFARCRDALQSVAMFRGMVTEGVRKTEVIRTPDGEKKRAPVPLASNEPVTGPAFEVSVNNRGDLVTSAPRRDAGGKSYAPRIKARSKA